MKTTLFILIAAAMQAQTSPGKVELPNWAGTGGEYSTSTSPHFSGWAAFAVPVNTALGAYSFTIEQALLQDGKIVTAVTTGIDDILKAASVKRGTWTLHGIATIGGASTPTATTAAFAGGGGLMFTFKEKFWIFPAGFTIEGFAIQNKAGSSAKPSILLGGGWTW
jgi:hypothetical protein